MFMRLVLAAALLAPALEGHARMMDAAWIHEAVSLHDRSLDLVFVDVADAAPEVFPGLAREAGAVLQRLGVRTRWQRGGHGVVASEHELTVVLMNGPAAGVAPHVLGATLVSDRSVRTVWIYLPHVAATLGLDPHFPGRRQAAEIALLGTALGRVAAHEILHALVPTLPHSASGLMAEKLGRAALVGPAVDVPGSFRAALRPALLRRASAE